MSFLFGAMDLNSIVRLCILFLMFTSLFLVGCSFSSVENPKEQSNGPVASTDDSNQSAENSDKNTKEKIAKHMQLNGTILYQQLEGGFFGFISDSGDKYLPIGLAKQFKQNGLKVKLVATKIEDIVTTQQFGQSIKVIEVTVIDKSKVSPAQKDL